MITQRDAFFDRLYEIAQNDDNVYLITVDMGAPSLDKWRENHSDHFLNVGPSEQIAIAMAGGMAMEGKNVFVYGICSFLAGRAWEQLKTVISLMNLPVTIVGVGAGFAYDKAGATHHSLEDIGMVAALPHFTVYNPAEHTVATALADVTHNAKGPCYVRLNRGEESKFYKDGQDWSKYLNTVVRHRDGQCPLVVTTGGMLPLGFALCDTFEKIGWISGLIDVSAFPVDESVFSNELSWNSKHIITIEEHNPDLGLGAAIRRIVQDWDAPSRVMSFGVNAHAGYSHECGGREALHKEFGLDLGSIFKKVYDRILPTLG